MTHPNNDPDLLDGMCDDDFEMLPPLADQDIAGHVLFADVDIRDLRAIEARRAEWIALFGRGDD